MNFSSIDFKYECKVCSKKFQVQSDYQNHIKKKGCTPPVIEQKETKRRKSKPVKAPHSTGELVECQKL